MPGPNGELQGADVLLRVETSPGSGQYITIGSQTNVNTEEQNAEIDMSSKESRRYRGIPGRYSSTVQLQHLYIPNSSGYAILKSGLRNGTNFKIRVRESGTDVEEADCFVTSLGRPAPDQQAVVVSVGLRVSDGWTAVS